MVAKQYVHIERKPNIIIANHNCQAQGRKMTKFPLRANGVPRSQVYANVIPRSAPHQHQCTCLQSHLQTSPPYPQKSYTKFRNPRTTFENLTLCPAKYSIVRGEWGSPKDFCGDNLNMNIRHIHLSTTWYNKQMAGLTNTGFLRPIQFQYNNQYL